MNLVAAMPVFANSAATTALVPPSVDMRHSVTAAVSLIRMAEYVQSKRPD